MKIFLKKLFYKYDKVSFIISLPLNSKVLDVGCGNNSPYITKTIRPDIAYYGIDVSDYNHSELPDNHADYYCIVHPELFDKKISEFNCEFDAVISSHNLEHCQKQDSVLSAMANSLKIGGRIFLSFPAEHTVNLPSRYGTLNFYDDPTHLIIPNFESVCCILNREGVSVEKKIKKFRPLIGIIIGFFTEPFSRARKKVMIGTWSLYGFESIIWGRKTKSCE